MCYNRKWKKSFIFNLNKFGVIRKTKYRIDGIWLGCSPRVWGWFLISWTILGQQQVFPTGVGVILEFRLKEKLPQSVPHGCGGDSIALSVNPSQLLYSPRECGWFRKPWRQKDDGLVFPTGVGVPLQVLGTWIYWLFIPYWCGDGSLVQGNLLTSDQSSPRCGGDSGSRLSMIPAISYFPRVWD